MKILTNKQRKEIASIVVNIFDITAPKCDTAAKETVKYGTLHILNTLFGVKGTQRFLISAREDWNKSHGMKKGK